jgi:DNA invertase Pin-like site-specific DNA recombinase
LVVIGGAISGSVAAEILADLGRLDAMWADCRQRRIDICLVVALDRLARSLTSRRFG